MEEKLRSKRSQNVVYKDSSQSIRIASEPCFKSQASKLLLQNLTANTEIINEDDGLSPRRSQRDSTQLNIRTESHFSMLENSLVEDGLLERRNHDNIGLSPRRLENILRKCPRGPFESQKLCEYLIESNNYFKNLSEGENKLSQEALEKLCSSLKLEIYSPGEVIFKEGDPSNQKFYIIYSGQVHIIQKNLDIVTKTNLHSQEKPKSNLLDTHSNSFSSSSESSMDEPDPLEKPTNQVIYIPQKKSIFLKQEDNNSPPVQTNFSQKKDLFRKSLNLRLEPNLIPTKHDPIIINPLRFNRGITNGMGSPEGSIGSIEPLSALSQSRADSIKASSDGNATTRRRMSTTYKRLVELEKISRKNSLESPDTVKTEITKKSKVPDKNKIREKVLRKARRLGMIKDTIGKGTSFGEMALISNNPRGATVMAAERTELLVIDAEDYKIIRSKDEPEKKRVVQFMIEQIPDLDQIHSVRIIEDLSYLLERRVYRNGNLITREGQRGEDLFLLFQGRIEISKNIEIEEREKIVKSPINHFRVQGTLKEDLLISFTDTPGSFIGEEVLFEKSKHYYFTTKVTSGTAIIYAINKNKFFYRFHPGTKLALQKLYEIKSKERIDIVKRKLSIKYPNLILKSEFEDIPDQGYLKEKITLELPKRSTNQMNWKIERKPLNPPQGFENTVQRHRVPNLDLSAINSPHSGSILLGDPQTDKVLSYYMGARTSREDSVEENRLSSTEKNQTDRSKLFLRNSQTDRIKNLILKQSGRDFDPVYYYNGASEKLISLRNQRSYLESDNNSPKQASKYREEKSQDQIFTPFFPIDINQYRNYKVRRSEISKNNKTKSSDAKLPSIGVASDTSSKNTSQKISNLATSKGTIFAAALKDKISSEDFEKLYYSKLKTIKSYLASDKAKPRFNDYMFQNELASNEKTIPEINNQKLPKQSNFSQAQLLQKKQHNRNFKYKKGFLFHKAESSFETSPRGKLEINVRN